MSNSPEIFWLQNADSLVTICPEIGGAITRFAWRDLEVLRPASDAAIRERVVRQMSCYPLIPYSNRIENGELIVDGNVTRLRANSPPEPHAIHGFGWQRPWHMTSHTKDTVQLALEHDADQDWPYACDAVETIRLTSDSLHLSLRVRNRDEKSVPVGLGFHPNFPTSHHTRLQTECKKMWRMDAQMLPTELGAIPPDADFSRSRPLAGWKVDNCFTGWSGRAVLDYPTHRVELQAVAACGQLVCFAPDDGRNFIALEPVTNINNAFALAARGVADTGTKILAPGDNFEISMSIQVSSPSAPVSNS